MAASEGPAMIKYSLAAFFLISLIPLPPKLISIGIPKVAEPTVPPLAERIVVKLFTGIIKAFLRSDGITCGARKAM